ncbi:MAG: GGDEF domain-containing protein [Ilumatobacter sp.]|jgi:predicted signal transduction protein with EAL and GGDEF domain|uniref:GGDEF domain-containing protein n=1 Tax=Ilumatobacter sp. TaxID=1967498 RepID=UPI00391D8FC4
MKSTKAADGSVVNDRRTKIVDAPGWGDDDELCGLLLLSIEECGVDAGAVDAGAVDASIVEVVVQRVIDDVTAQVRPTDVIVALGGSEFAVVLPGADAAHVAEVAERVRVAVSGRRVDVDGRSVRYSVSVGATGRFPSSEQLVDELLAQADESLTTQRRAADESASPRDPH